MSPSGRDLDGDLAALVQGTGLRDVIAVGLPFEESRLVGGRQQAVPLEVGVLLGGNRDGLLRTGTGRASGCRGDHGRAVAPFRRPLSTANGTAQAAFVELDEVRVGSIVRRDVKAVVTRGLSGALLGMSFFNTLSKVSMESDELVLKD